MFHTGSVLGNLQTGECLEKLRGIFPVLESLWEAYFYYVLVTFWKVWEFPNNSQWVVYSRGFR